jgi:hypothetical protein
MSPAVDDQRMMPKKWTVEFHVGDYAGQCGALGSAHLTVQVVENDVAGLAVSSMTDCKSSMGIVPDWGSGTLSDCELTGNMWVSEVFETPLMGAFDACLSASSQSQALHGLTSGRETCERTSNVYSTVQLFEGTTNLKQIAYTSFEEPRLVSNVFSPYIDQSSSAHDHALSNNNGQNPVSTAAFHIADTV